MSLRLIKEGIENGDWSKVVSGYKLMSGDSNVNLKKKNISKVENDGIASTGVSLENKNKTGPNGEKNTRTIPLKLSTVNLFTDTGLEFQDEENKTPKKKTIKKTKRAKAKFVSVECSKCGEEFKRDKDSLPISYNGEKDKQIKKFICDDCIASQRIN